MKNNTLPKVVANKFFNGKDGRPWTKFLLSTGKDHLEQGHMQGPYIVTKDAKGRLSVWSVAK